MTTFDQYLQRQNEDPKFRDALAWVTLGENLREARALCHLTQKQLAKRLKTNGDVIQMMEEDPEQVPRELLARAVQFFDATLQEPRAKPVQESSDVRPPVQRETAVRIAWRATSLIAKPHEEIAGH